MERVKFGTVTVMLTAAVALSAPDVPVTTAAYVPATAVVLAAKVTVLLLVVVAGLKTAVTPVGNPVAVSKTVPVNPLAGVTVSVLLALPLLGSVKLLTEEARPKLGTTTVRAMAAVLVTVVPAALVLLPVIVSG